MTGNRKMTMGVIVGNRGFFPAALAEAGREAIIKTLSGAGIDVVVLTPEQSRHGAVENHDEAKRCAESVPGRMAIASTASSSPCRTSATSARSPTRCAWRTSTFRCWCRPRPTAPARCRSNSVATASAARCRCATTCASTAFPISLTRRHVVSVGLAGLRRGPAVVRRRVPGRARDCATCAIGCIGARVGRVQHRALQREDPGGERHLGRDHRPLRNHGPDRRASTTTSGRDARSRLRAYVPVQRRPERRS